MNLIKEAWIPVRRRSGQVERISPSQISEEDIVSLAAPRPDFNGALIQFLIGLLQTTSAPENRRAWLEWLREPPLQETLQAAFETVVHAFELDGDGSRFMQDFTLKEEVATLPPKKQAERTNTIDELFIDEPTGKTLSDNTDHFIKRGRIVSLCLPCASTALMTLQMNAPSGGQGHRTGLRGGGPMTTLLLSETLWKTCWMNTLNRSSFLSTCGNLECGNDADRFPWLAPARTSEGGRTTTPEDVHPDQIFWSMPRRIHFLISGKEAVCSLCEREVHRGVTHFITKNLGVNYEGAWLHPLTPYFIDKEGLPNARHPQPGGIGYKHWLGLVQAVQDKRGKQQPAKVVEQFFRRRQEGLRLWAFGYDMDNMKARCWYDSTMPLVLADETIRDVYEFHVSALVNATQQIARETRACVKKALFNPGHKVKGDLSFIDVRFWQETEADFFHFLPRLRDALTENGDALPILEDWRKRLIKEAEVIFDDLSQTGAFEAADPKRIALAWRDLQKSICGKKVRELLGLPKK